MLTSNVLPYSGVLPYAGSTFREILSGEFYSRGAIQAGREAVADVAQQLISAGLTQRIRDCFVDRRIEISPDESLEDLTAHPKKLKRMTPHKAELWAVAAALNQILMDIANQELPDLPELTPRQKSDRKIVNGYEMIYVPGGSYVVNFWSEGCSKPRWVILDPFWIGKSLMNRGQYLSSLQRFGVKSSSPPGDPNAPAVGMGSFDALVMAPTYGVQAKANTFLPTAAQWQAAVGGPPVNMRTQMTLEGVRVDDFHEWAGERYTNFFIPTDPLRYGTMIYTETRENRFMELLKSEAPLYGWRRVFSNEWTHGRVELLPGLWEFGFEDRLPDGDPVEGFKKLWLTGPSKSPTGPKTGKARPRSRKETALMALIRTERELRETFGNLRIARPSENPDEQRIEGLVKRSFEELGKISKRLASRFSTEYGEGRWKGNLNEFVDDLWLVIVEAGRFVPPLETPPSTTTDVRLGVWGGFVGPDGDGRTGMRLVCP